MIWPKERGVDGRPVEPRPEVMDDLVANTAQVAIWRERLADLGWIMKALKEDIAKRANKEDGCSGAFWEGRFKSVPLLDQQALLACMAYVELADLYVWVPAVSWSGCRAPGLAGA